MRRVAIFGAGLLLACLIACGGGGGGGSTGGGGGIPVQTLTITTGSDLPITVTGYQYSTTLAAKNGQGSLTWSIARVSSTTEFVDGLVIDEQTGVLSGTVNFLGTAAFVANVKDSGGKSASKSFTITAYSVLQGGLSSASVSEFQTLPAIYRLNVQGGAPPLKYALSGGSLPPGLRVSSDGVLAGAATAIGSFHANLTVQDSFSPPQLTTAQVDVMVSPFLLSIANQSFPQNLLVNHPFHGRVVATGGVPPYHFSVGTGGVWPPGLAPVDDSGNITGTPSQRGGYSFTVKVTDSNSPPQNASATFFTIVSQPHGRNDTPATATAMDGTFTISASISPYISPPNGAPVEGDTDYFKFISVSGSTIHIEAHANQSLLDTVIEVVDSNGIQFSSCRQPGDTRSNFTGACLNDDIGGSPHSTDSALDFQVPGGPGAPTSFIVHVLDWRGDARPDMQYSLSLSGINAPLKIDVTPLRGGARGKNYNQRVGLTNGTQPITLSVSSGTLPPGLSVDSPSASVQGIPTTDGTYSFTLQATDSSNPPQTVTAPVTIQVVEPVHITSSAPLPDACEGQPFTFTFTAADGLPPYTWSYNGVGFSINQSTGVMSGIPPFGSAGTYPATLVVSDGTVYGDFQTTSLTIKTCP